VRERVGGWRLKREEKRRREEEKWSEEEISPDVEAR
jgi:hypothetical protein